MADISGTASRIWLSRREAARHRNVGSMLELPWPFGRRRPREGDVMYVRSDAHDLLRWRLQEAEQNASHLRDLLNRMAERQKSLLDALELAAEYVDDYCATRTKALGHLPPCDERARGVVHAVITSTKGARNG